MVSPHYTFILRREKKAPYHNVCYSGFGGRAEALQSLPNACDQIFLVGQLIGLGLKHVDFFFIFFYKIPTTWVAFIVYFMKFLHMDFPHKSWSTHHDV